MARPPIHVHGIIIYYVNDREQFNICSLELDQLENYDCTGTLVNELIKSNK
jgi:hypothetical protein